MGRGTFVSSVSPRVPLGDPVGLSPAAPPLCAEQVLTMGVLSGVAAMVVVGLLRRVLPLIFTSDEEVSVTRVRKGRQ